MVLSGSGIVLLLPIKPIDIQAVWCEGSCFLITLVRLNSQLELFRLPYLGNVLGEAVLSEAARISRRRGRQALFFLDFLLWGSIFTLVLIVSTKNAPHYGKGPNSCTGYVS